MLGVCVAPRRAVRAPRLLALCSASLRAAPQDQPRARGRFPEGGGEYGCPGEGSIPSLSPLSAQRLPEPRAGGRCVCTHAPAWENPGEPTANRPREFHGSPRLHR